MKTFEIGKLEDNYIIFSTSYINPLENLDEISKQLSKKKFLGNVVFDLLLINGFSSNRFIKGIFDGKNFDLSSFYKLDNEIEKYKQLSKQYYFANSYLLDNSTLTKIDKFLYLNNKKN